MTVNYQLIDGEAVDLTGEPQRKAQAHARAEVLARALGDFAQDPAPSESSLQYRKRLVTQFQRFSPEWRAVDVRPLDRNTFERVELKVYADAAQEARAPTALTVPPGQVVMRSTRDPTTGRLINRFYGSPDAVWGPFRNPSRRLLGINTPTGFVKLGHD
jgi:hypothetical protein